MQPVSANINKTKAQRNEIDAAQRLLGRFLFKVSMQFCSDAGKYYDGGCCSVEETENG